MRSVGRVLNRVELATAENTISLQLCADVNTMPGKKSESSSI